MKTTSAAVSGVPSCQRTSSRKRYVIVRPSGDIPPLRRVGAARTRRFVRSRCIALPGRGVAATSDALVFWVEEWRRDARPTAAFDGSDVEDAQNKIDHFRNGGRHPIPDAGLDPSLHVDLPTRDTDDNASRIRAPRYPGRQSESYEGAGDEAKGTNADDRSHFVGDDEGVDAQ